jgi:hypothetical protein
MEMIWAADNMLANKIQDSATQLCGAIVKFAGFDESSPEAAASIAPKRLTGAACLRLHWRTARAPIEQILFTPQGRRGEQVALPTAPVAVISGE